MAGRVTLIGREREIGHITTVVDRVAGGQGRIVFLTGEPGIGKTRFAEWTLGKPVAATDALHLSGRRGAIRGVVYPDP